MEHSASINSETTLRILPYLIAVMHWLSGTLPSPPPKRPQGVPFHLVLMIHREQRAEVKRTRAATRTLCTTRGSP